MHHGKVEAERARIHETGKLGRGRELRGTFQSGTHQRTSTLFQHLVSSFCVLRCIIVCVQAGELHHDRQHRGGHHLLPHAGANTLSRKRHRARLRVGVLKLHFTMLRQGAASQHTRVVLFEGAHERQLIGCVTKLLGEVSGQEPVAAHRLQRPGAKQSTGVAARHAGCAHNRVLIDATQLNPQVGEGFLFGGARRLGRVGALPARQIPGGQNLAGLILAGQNLLHAPLKLFGQGQQGVGDIGAGVLIGHGEAVELVERVAVAFDGGAGGGGPRYAEAVGAHAGAAVNLALFGALVLFCVHATLLVGFVSFAWFSAGFSASSRLISQCPQHGQTPAYFVLLF